MGATADVEVLSVARWHVVAKVLSRTYASPQTLALLGAPGAQGWVDGTVVAGGVLGGAADTCGVVSGGSAGGGGGADDGDYGEKEAASNAAISVQKDSGKAAAASTTPRPAHTKSRRRPWILIFSLFFTAIAILVAKWRGTIA